ncbi:rod shape-determining protein MreC [Ructibacterium gallinarum]|uniref:Cell shape-determining protein MreC n=1 Tax=Ructibacterium gallinarum TaxID=2779355 RepID=A0A9D5LXL6_9FIRM|nr:rod shape-determining protein MreC [Ructibacterium gallinarum]MBE5039768.1 rod shape-determining protein MreC [Ructibacterium gallinarum]
MRNFFENKQLVFLVAATLVIAVMIGIFGASAGREKVNAAENAVGAAAAAGQSASSGMGGWFSNIFEYFGSVKALREENEQLKAANVELDKRVRDAQGLEEENAELRQMLDLAENEKKLELTAASVIAKDPSNWYSSFTINKGTNDGIQKNQPVLTANKELIGQVYRVGSSWAEVITILDPESGVGSMVERSKDIGILEGDSALRYQGQCRLGYLSRDTDIEPGDYVETSGLGGVYPKGLLIGKVLEVKEDNTTMSKYASVEPIVDMSKLSQVFVLKNHVDDIGRLSGEEETTTDNGKEDTDKKTENGEEEDEDKTSSSSSSSKSGASATSKPSSTSGSSNSRTTAKPSQNTSGGSSSGGNSSSSSSSGNSSSGSSSSGGNSSSSNSSNSSSSGGNSSSSNSSSSSSSGSSSSGNSSSGGSMAGDGSELRE